jgi:hypothetical protein
VAVLGKANYAAPYAFTTLAGYANHGTWAGTRSAAQFNYPEGVAVVCAGPAGPVSSAGRNGGVVIDPDRFRRASTRRENSKSGSG